MRYVIIILLCLALPLTAQEIEPNLKHYYDSFLQEANNRGVNVDISKLKMVAFPNLSKYEEILKELKLELNTTSWHGVTLTNQNNGAIYVFVNASYFFAVCKTVKEMVVYHELSHALLGKKLTKGHALMDCRQFNIKYYNKNKKQILDEIFSR